MKNQDATYAAAACHRRFVDAEPRRVGMFQNVWIDNVVRQRQLLASTVVQAKISNEVEVELLLSGC